MGGRPSSDARWVITSGLFSAVLGLARRVAMGVTGRHTKGAEGLHCG